MDITLDFERPVSELENQIRELRNSSSGSIDINHEIDALQAKVDKMLEEIYEEKLDRITRGRRAGCLRFNRLPVFYRRGRRLLPSGPVGQNGI